MLEIVLTTTPELTSVRPVPIGPVLVSFLSSMGKGNSWNDPSAMDACRSGIGLSPNG